ncbi:hypothetical protein, partial [Rothia mucilaginosa]|uniref:hypothetical protein n=1 Tax=Rothia mucilaginosa TaxID=43675 RepID=UPI0026EE62C0
LIPAPLSYVFFDAVFAPRHSRRYSACERLSRPTSSICTHSNNSRHSNSPAPWQLGKTKDAGLRNII